MFKFNAVQNKKVVEYTISIEQKTRLMVVEQKFPNEEYPRYIRLTGQQVERLKRIVFVGRFASNTIPINLFSIEDGNTFVLVCRENNQVIRIPHSEMSKVFGYYDKHAQHIARLDCMFRSRR